MNLYIEKKGLSTSEVFIGDIYVAIAGFIESMMSGPIDSKGGENA